MARRTDIVMSEPARRVRSVQVIGPTGILFVAEIAKVRADMAGNNSFGMPEFRVGSRAKPSPCR
jgi:hypothetical protein